MWNRLRLLGIAVTAAQPSTIALWPFRPPQTSWNRGDCGVNVTPDTPSCVTASDFLESR